MHKLLEVWALSFYKVWAGLVTSLKKALSIGSIVGPSNCSFRSLALKHYCSSCQSVCHTGYIEFWTWHQNYHASIPVAKVILSNHRVNCPSGL